MRCKTFVDAVRQGLLSISRFIVISLGYTTLDKHDLPRVIFLGRIAGVLISLGNKGYTYQGDSRILIFNFTPLMQL